MERTIGQLPAEKRSLPLSPALYLAAGLFGLTALGMSLLAAQTVLGHALLLLGRHALRLVPPLLWPLALLAIALWVAALRREWSRS